MVLVDGQTVCLGAAPQTDRASVPQSGGVFPICGGDATDRRADPLFSHCSQMPVLIRPIFGNEMSPLKTPSGQPVLMGPLADLVTLLTESRMRNSFDQYGYCWLG